MANTILIKKAAYNSTTAPSGTGSGSSLQYGELGWLNNNTGSTGKLYIGGKTASSASPAGETYPVDIQANILSAVPDLGLTSDSGSVAIDIGAETLTIAGGEGITTSGSSNTITVAAEDATASNKGVASFHTDNFLVSSGAVTIANGGVILGTETTGNYVATAVAGAGIDVSGATGNVTVSIGTGEVVNAMIGDNEVAGEHYAAGSVDATALGTGSVTTVKVGANQITTAKLAQASGSEAVTTACIQALNITSALLNTNSVTNAKIVDSAVTSAKIANGTIVAADIASGTITGTQITSGVSLAGDVTIAGGLTVAGTTTSVNSTNLTVKDKNIICASDQGGDPLTVTGVAGAGLTVGTNGSAPKITWDNLDATDYWNVSHSLKFTAKSATIDCGAY